MHTVSKASKSYPCGLHMLHVAFDRNDLFINQSITICLPIINTER